MEQEEMSLDLPEVLRLVRRNALFLVVCALWGALFAFALSLFILPTRYQAVAMMVVNVGKQEADANGEQLSVARQMVGTCAVLLTNDSLMGELIETHQLDISVEELHKRVEVKPIEQTQVLHLAVRHEDPAVAVAMLDTIVERAPLLLASAARGGVVDVISPPWVDTRPVSPHLGRNIVVGAALGFLLCGLGLLVHHMMDNRIHSQAEAEKQLGLPVLVRLPEVRRQLEDSPELQESFSFLKAVLWGLPQNGGNRTLMVTAALPREGSSSVAAGLARVLASGGKTLLLDADLRGETAECFGGLVGVLQGSFTAGECTRYLAQEGYWRLAAGGPTAQSAQLLDSDAMCQLMKQLKDEFDQIVVDTPAVLAAADAMLMSRFADATLLVARCKKGAAFSQGRQALRFLDACGTPVAGVVLNGAEPEKIQRKRRWARKHGYS